MQGPILKACAISLLVHVLALGIPAGRVVPGTGKTEALGRAGPWDAAPLTVDLGPRALELPSLPSPAEAIVAAPRTQATMVEQQATGRGNRGDEAPIPDELASPPAPAVGIPAAHYYPPSELTRRPRILRDVDPYLGELKHAPGSGQAVIVLWINEHGGVDRVKAEDSTLPAPFEAEILAQFRESRFEPAERDGRPAKSLLKLAVEVMPRTRVSSQSADSNAYRPVPQE